MNEHETKIELCGESLPAVIGYHLDDGDGANGICIYSVRIKRCIAERGSLKWMPDGDCYTVMFHEYIWLEIFPFLNGRQIKILAEEINEHICEMNWDEVMNEPRYSLPCEFPTNFPGVRL